MYVLFAIKNSFIHSFIHSFFNPKWWWCKNKIVFEGKKIRLTSTTTAVHAKFVLLTYVNVCYVLSGLISIFALKNPY